MVRVPVDGVKRAPRGDYYYAQLDTGEIVMVSIASQLITEFLD